MANEEFIIVPKGETYSGKTWRDSKGYDIPEYGESKPMAQDTMNALISENDNKDFFELLKGMLPKGETAENFIPPVGLFKLMQLMNQPKETEQAMYRGLTESMFGEPNPVGPQGLPFNQFMQEKQDQKVKSILQQYTNDLIK